ncbi:hypothetical protein EDC04DRAFT_2167448 [Pisolithus marmoratus]|nr:hypothetical protein EDC04DRAFT_2167448 [Pisolithus marmoratus]
MCQYFREEPLGCNLCRRWHDTHRASSPAVYRMSSLSLDDCPIKAPGLKNVFSFTCVVVVLVSLELQLRCFHRSHFPTPPILWQTRTDYICVLRPPHHRTYAVRALVLVNVAVLPRLPPFSVTHGNHLYGVTYLEHSLTKEAVCSSGQHVQELDHLE